MQPHSHCSEALLHPGPELWLSDWAGDLSDCFRIIILGMGQSNLLTKAVGGLITSSLSGGKAQLSKAVIETFILLKILEDGNSESLKLCSYANGWGESGYVLCPLIFT